MDPDSIGPLDPYPDADCVSDPDSRSGSKGTKKAQKKVKRFHLLKCAGCSLLEGWRLLPILDVLYGCLGIATFDQKKKEKKFSYSFHNFWSSNSKPWIRIRIRIQLKCWIRIRISDTHHWSLGPTWFTWCPGQSWRHHRSAQLWWPWWASTPAQQRPCFHCCPSCSRT